MLSPYFDLEPLPSLFSVYLSSVRCFLPSRGKKLTSCSCSSSPSSSVRLYGICCKLTLWVPNCMVVSHNVVGFSSQYWLLLFFLRFWLMLRTASSWAGSDFSRLWCCLPRRWFAVNSPCSSWFSRSSFWGSDFYALFHSSRTVLQFVDFVLSPFPSLFSHLVAAFIAARISCSSPFRHAYHSRFA